MSHDPVTVRLLHLSVIMTPALNRHEAGANDAGWMNGGLRGPISGTDAGRTRAEEKTGGSRMTGKTLALIASAALLSLAAPSATHAQNAQATDMTFFVTSVGVGNGADLGGLAGADAHCQRLAQAAGSNGKTWRAYLSTQGQDATNAKDRIGNGPWQNAKGAVIAKDVAELHGSNNLTKQTALNEKGEVINGRGDTPNRHDILTGSQPDGTAFAGAEDRTCRNWSSSAQGAAMVGHSDRTGLDDSAAAKSWNSSHPSRGSGGGCTQADLRSTGGDGLFYCFAAN
jgi:hypothetical protein